MSNKKYKRLYDNRIWGDNQSEPMTPERKEELKRIEKEVKEKYSNESLIPIGELTLPVWDNQLGECITPERQIELDRIEKAVKEECKNEKCPIPDSELTLPEWNN